MPTRKGAGGGYNRHSYLSQYLGVQLLDCYKPPVRVTALVLVVMTVMNKTNEIISMNCPHVILIMCMMNKLRAVTIVIVISLIHKLNRNKARLRLYSLYIL